MPDVAISYSFLGDSHNQSADWFRNDTVLLVIAWGSVGCGCPVHFKQGSPQAVTS